MSANSNFKRRLGAHKEISQAASRYGGRDDVVIPPFAPDTSILSQHNGAIIGRDTISGDPIFRSRGSYSGNASSLGGLGLIHVDSHSTRLRADLPPHDSDYMPKKFRGGRLPERNRDLKELLGSRLERSYQNGLLLTACNITINSNNRDAGSTQAQFDIEEAFLKMVQAGPETFGEGHWIRRIECEEINHEVGVKNRSDHLHTVVRIFHNVKYYSVSKLQERCQNFLNGVHPGAWVGVALDIAGSRKSNYNHKVAIKKAQEEGLFLKGPHYSYYGTRARIEFSDPRPGFPDVDTSGSVIGHARHLSNTTVTSKRRSVMQNGSLVLGPITTSNSLANSGEPWYRPDSAYESFKDEELGERFRRLL